ncbi:hypothetical protein KHM83_01015 [Fusibacter paucivorans]|uniref:Lipoprotein n=1 Tax=Fusibacter paucivorans TaxID=76009 RepID=A0ABS5PJE6_9FIRM|nr:MSCRAMM family adhesin SdrC [Fusibacter paucivorans]MBS7525249.1 hypothetical protein [Fusibacter paucivorans]
MRKSVLTGFVCLLMFTLSACGNTDSNTDRPENSPSNSTGSATENSTAESTAESAQSIEVNGIIFEDLNENQIFDADEIGLSGIDIIYSGSIVTSSDDGTFLIEAAAPIAIQIDIGTLPAGYHLTTQNDTQTVSDADGFEPIGYAPASGSEALSIDTLLNANHDAIQSYAFDLYMNTNGMEAGSLHYAANATNFVAEDDNMITYYLGDSGKIGVYTKASNQLMVTPATETMEMVTPFTAVEQLEPDAIDAMHYKGTETFDGKTVHIFKSEIPGFTTELYIWDTYGLVVQMSTEANGNSAVMAFRNLIINDVDDSVFAFPAGAEIIDLTNLGG